MSTTNVTQSFQTRKDSKSTKTYNSIGGDGFTTEGKEGTICDYCGFHMSPLARLNFNKGQFEKYNFDGEKRGYEVYICFNRECDSFPEEKQVEFKILHATRTASSISENDKRGQGELVDYRMIGGFTNVRGPQTGNHLLIKGGEVTLNLDTSNFGIHFYNGEKIYNLLNIVFVFNDENGLMIESTQLKKVKNLPAKTRARTTILSESEDSSSGEDNFSEEEERPVRRSPTVRRRSPTTPRRTVPILPTRSARVSRNTPTVVSTVSRAPIRKIEKGANSRKKRNSGPMSFSEIVRTNVVSPYVYTPSPSKTLLKRNKEVEEEEVEEEEVKPVKKTFTKKVWVDRTEKPELTWEEEEERLKKKKAVDDGWTFAGDKTKEKKEQRKKRKELRAINKATWERYMAKDAESVEEEI